MATPDTPKDGDFASYLGSKTPAPSKPMPENAPDRPAESASVAKTIQQVLEERGEPTEEFLAEMQALENAPPLSDEELERQALSAPGDDNDVETPE